MADRREKWAQAKAHLRGALSLAPSHVRMRHLLALAHHRTGQPARAMEQFQMAARILATGLHPKDGGRTQRREAAALHSDMGLALEAEGRLQAAADSYVRAINLVSDFSKAYLRLGRLLAADGQLRLAVHFYRQLTWHVPGCAEGRVALAETLEARGLSAEAARAYGDVIRADPGHAAAMERRAALLLSVGHVEAARAQAAALLEALGRRRRALHAERRAYIAELEEGPALAGFPRTDTVPGDGAGGGTGGETGDGTAAAEPPPAPRADPAAAGAGSGPDAAPRPRVSARGSRRAAALQARAAALEADVARARALLDAARRDAEQLAGADGLLLRARGASSASDARGALDLARRACEAAPRSSEGRFLVELGRLHEEAGQLADAQTAYRRALQARPPAPEAHVALGSLLQRTGRESGAAKLFEAFLEPATEWEDDSRCAELRTRAQASLARLYRARGDLRRAAPLYAAWAAAERKARRETARRETAPRETAPRGPRREETLGGRNSEVPKLAGRAARNEAAEGLTWVLAQLQEGTALGLALLREEQHAEAATRLRESLRRTPDDARAALGLARAQTALGRDAEALALFRSVRRDHPAFDAASLRDLGALLRRRGEHREALVRLRDAHRRAPADPAVLHMLGSELFLMGDAGAAATVLQESSRLQPDRSSAANDLGAAQYALGRHDEAEATFRRSLALEDAFEPRVNLALSLRGMGRVDEAADQLERASEGTLDVRAGGAPAGPTGGGEAAPEQRAQVLRLLAELRRRQGRADLAAAADERAAAVEAAAVEAAAGDGR
jgi:tetratricopeptide (TPR) repeat protein